MNIEEKPNLVECLNFRISQKDTFYKKIPTFREQIQKCNESIAEIKNKFEGIRRRESYKSVLDEFKDLLKQKRQN